MRDIEGKATRVGASELGSERVSTDNRTIGQAESGGLKASPTSRGRRSLHSNFGCQISDVGFRIAKA